MRKLFEISWSRGLVITTLLLLSLSTVAQTTEMETRYNALAERFDGRDKLLQRDLKAYLQAFPYTTFTDEVKFMHTPKTFSG